MAMTKYTKAAEKIYNPQLKTALADRKTLYKQQKRDVNDVYDKKVFEEGRAYEDQYRENAVQKAINERQIAESMANLGLTDSGLNRTQQTAVQLSYANNKAGIDRQRQGAIDSLELARTGDLSALNQGYLADKASINQTYKNAIADTAKELYKEAISASKSGGGGNQPTTNIINSKNGMLSRGYTGLLENNGVSYENYTDSKGNKYTKYIDRVTGYEATFRADTNPYTNTVNHDVKNGTFKGGVGYQPDNITIDGTSVKLKWADTTELKNLGRSQNVFKTTTKNRGTQYWLWDDSSNQYLEVYKKGNEWFVK
jgi:hypothetical protein